MNERRKILSALGAGTLAAALPAFAQLPARVWRVGWLTLNSASNVVGVRTLEGFLGAMRKLGFVEGKNFTLERKFAEGNPDRLPSMAAELVSQKVNVIVGVSGVPVRAAQQATSNIPIVMMAIGNPVGLGFTASLSRPSGNITGLSNNTTDISPKYIELLKTALPGLARVALLVNPDNPTTPALVPLIRAAAKASGVGVTSIQARKPDEIEGAFKALDREGARALIAVPDVMLLTESAQINRLATARRIATVFWDEAGAESGGFMSYGVDLDEQWQRLAGFVEKILKGAKPGELPIEFPTRYSLVINRKAAKAIGVTLPQELLLRADRVIE